MLVPYMIGAIVVTIGLVLIFLRKTTELVNLRYGDAELTLPAGFLLVIIGIVIPIGGHILDMKGFNLSQNSPAPTMKTTPGNADPNALNPTTQNPTFFSIKIDPVNIPVPCRFNFTGTGDVPSDRVLWLVVQRIGTPKYYTKPAAVNVADHKWVVADVTVGTKDTPAGSLYMIYAVLADDETNQLLKQRQPKVPLEKIPGRQVDQIQVSRSGDGNDC